MTEDWDYVKRTDRGTVHASARLRTFDEILAVLSDSRDNIVALYVDFEVADNVQEIYRVFRQMDKLSNMGYETRLITLACAPSDSGEGFIEAMKAHIDTVYGGGRTFALAGNVYSGRGGIAPDIDAILDSERLLFEKHGKL